MSQCKYSEFSIGSIPNKKSPVATFLQVQATGRALPKWPSHHGPESIFLAAHGGFGQCPCRKKPKPAHLPLHALGFACSIRVHIEKASLIKTVLMFTNSRI